MVMLSLGPSMRAAFVASLVVLLGVMLASTTPIGTGSGVHQSALLHPLFEHAHIVNGRVLSHEQLEAQADRAARQAAEGAQQPGPAIGAGAGAAAADAGLGLSPTIPWQPPSLLMAVSAWQVSLQTRAPEGRVEAPPDPPPTSAA